MRTVCEASRNLRSVAPLIRAPPWCTDAPHERHGAQGPRRRPHQLRRSRLRRVSAPFLCALDGLFARAAREARGRHHLDGVGLQQLPSRRAGIDRGDKARRARRGCLAARLPRDLARRGFPRADQPAIVVAPGPMMTSRYRGERLGACTDCRRFWAKYRAGGVDSDEIETIEGRLATTEGTCAVMGTASTMAILIEVLGLMLPGTAAIPAVHADRLRAAEATGRAAVDLIGSGRTIDRIVTQASIDNAVRALLPGSGLTNAVVHLAAMAGRLGLRLDLDRLNRLSDETPVLVDLKPTGEGYMEDFFAAGGVGGLLQRMGSKFDLAAATVTGETLGDWVLPESAFIDPAVIRPVEDAVSDMGGLVALYGSLAPKGAILKRAAADAQ